jgi:hypothetical protein
MVDLLKLVLAMVLSMPPADHPAVEMGYAFSLTSVVREVAGQRVPLTAVSANGVSDDEVVTIKWAPAAPGGVYVWVINKSAAPAEIQWDESAYVAPDGVSQRIRHQGGVFKTTADPQAPTLVPAGAKIADMLVPVSHLYYSTPAGSTAGSWRFHPLLPTRVEVGKETDVLQALKGRSLQAVLTIAQADVRRRYTATFAIGDIRAELSGATPAAPNAMTEQPQASAPPTPAPSAMPSAVPAMPSAQPAPLPTAKPTASAVPDELRSRRDYRKDSR